MAPTYKVTYFEFRWYAEPIRYILSHLGEEFDDVRENEDLWGENEKKNYFRYGKLPALEIRQKDGSVLLMSQSFSISRYLARKHGLAAETLEEQQRCDEFADCLKDICGDSTTLFMDPNNPNKEERFKKYSEVTIPRYLKEIENELKKQKVHKIPATGVIPLVGKKLTWVDFNLAHFAEMYDIVIKTQKPGASDLLDSYPHIKEHQQAIFALPNIKKWIANRPPTQFNL